MEIENQVEEQEVSLRETIEQAVKETKEPVAVEVETEEKPSRDRDETGKFKTKEAVVEPEIKKAKINAPDSWSAPIKAKWDALDPEVQAEIGRREGDMHKMMTSPDGELSLGRKMKEVITPYMATIQAEGGEPVGAVRDLLNTAYVLRTAPPEQKAALIRQVIQQYGVDPNLVFGQQQQTAQPDPMQAIYQELQRLKDAVNPDNLQKQLQERMQTDNVMSEIKAFQLDAANVHYAKVEDAMLAIAPLMRAKNPAATPKEILKLSYDAACRADPEVYSTFEADRQAAEQAKKTQTLSAKRNAAVSVTGSPGVTVPNSGSPDRSLREELQANLRAFTS